MKFCTQDDWASEYFGVKKEKYEIYHKAWGETRLQCKECDQGPSLPWWISVVIKKRKKKFSLSRRSWRPVAFLYLFRGLWVMNPWLLFGNTQFQPHSCPKCIEIFAEFLVWHLPILISQRNWNNASGGFGSFADWSRWMKFNIHFFIAAPKFMSLPLNFTDFNWKQPRALGISSSAFFLLPSTQDQKNISTSLKDNYLQDVMVLNGIPMTDMQRSVITKLTSSRW